IREHLAHGLRAWARGDHRFPGRADRLTRHDSPASRSRSPKFPSGPERTAAMAVADDLDRATDSKWDWVAEHTRKYLASGGTEGHESNGVYTLVLATTGRRTGEPRRTCLIYGTSGDEFVVVASKFSPAMLEIARRRAAELGGPVDLGLGDAQALDLPDAAFD